MTITTFFYSTIIVIIVITSITYTIIFYRGFHINSKFYYWDIFPIMPLFFLIVRKGYLNKFSFFNSV